MLTDTKLADLITAITVEIAEDEAKLERKRIKLELLYELAKPEKPTKTPEAIATNGHAVTLDDRPYSGMEATAAIKKYLKDHSGTSSMKTMLDVLTPQIKTASPTPRAIVRNCAVQFVKRGHATFSPGGVIALK